MNYDSRRYALVNRWDKRHMATVQRLLDPRPGDRMLEVGCGVGHLTRRLREIGVNATGIDANPQAAHVAVSDGVEHMYAENLDYPDDTFDKIVSVHAIEHVPDIDGAFSEMARVAKPGAPVLLIYPAEPIQGIWAVPTAVILYKNPLKARDVHCQWLWPSKVERLAERHGFRHVHSEFNLLSTPQFVSLFEASGRA